VVQNVNFPETEQDCWHFNHQNLCGHRDFDP
jgi:hypothetical protein